MGDQVTPDEEMWRAGLGQRLDRQDEQIDSVRGELEANTKLSKEIDERLARLEAATFGLVEAFSIAQGGLKAMGSLARIAKPFGVIAGAVTAVVGVWVAIKAGLGIK